MKDLDLIIADQATADLTDIWLYIASDSPLAADRFIDFLQEKFLLLASSPELGRERNELIPGLRSLPVKRYTIFYRISATAVEIARVLSSYRDIDSLF